MAQTLKEKLTDEKTRFMAEIEQAQIEKEAKELEELVSSSAKFATEHSQRGSLIVEATFGLESYCQDEFLGIVKLPGSIWCWNHGVSSVYHCARCFDPSKLRGKALALYTVLSSEPLGFNVEPSPAHESYFSDFNGCTSERDVGKFKLLISW